MKIYKQNNFLYKQNNFCANILTHINVTNSLQQTHSYVPYIEQCSREIVTETCNLKLL